MLKRKQRGMSLVGVMIGLTISLIVSMTILALYRQSSVSSSISKDASLKMSSVSTALLSASNTLQKAGYFININNASDVAANLVLLSNAQFDGTTLTGAVVQTPTAIGQASVSGNALVWAWKDSAEQTTQCSGLVMIGEQMYLLQPNACTNALDYSSISWSSYELVKKGLATGTSIVASFNSCAIFSYGTKNNSPSIALNLAYNPVEGDSKTKTLTTNICLQNLTQ